MRSLHLKERERLIPARAGNTRARWRVLGRVSAHPRSRGEHALLRCVPWWCFGSSPLARGTLISFLAPIVAFRLIPARAGNTGSHTGGIVICPAHPRSRGEHMGNHSFLARGCGSSPLARGTHSFVLRRYCCARLIPARAGNTRSARHASKNFSAHPRSRGEHTTTFERNRKCPGSSPLARGTPNREP